MPQTVFEYYQYHLWVSKNNNLWIIKKKKIQNLNKEDTNLSRRLKYIREMIIYRQILL